MAESTQRRTAVEIFEAVVSSAHSELDRSGTALAFSGLGGGLTMGLTALGVACLQAIRHQDGPADATAMLLYPLGFIGVLIGRSQLFTENTLYPVVLILDERKYLGKTLKLWAVVFGTNVLGALLFALLACRTGACSPELAERLASLGLEAAHVPSTRVFWSAVMGGWLIALVAWTVTASHWTIGQIAMTFLLTYVVGAAHFAHCIAGSAEALSAVVQGQLSVAAYLRWLLLATSGNIVGGVFMVSLLNYGQVRGNLAEPESSSEEA